MVRASGSGSSSSSGSSAGSGSAGETNRNYVLTYAHAGGVHHTFLAEHSGGRLSFSKAKQQFDSIFDLVQLYCSMKQTVDIR